MSNGKLGIKDGTSSGASGQIEGRGESARPRYSICITHFNNLPTVRRSLESVLGQVDEDFEVVVVDQNSKDGSVGILEEYEKLGRIRLFHQKVRNRGLGREFAFENSRGKYIIANMDMDDTFRPTLRVLLARYHAVAEGRMMWVCLPTKGGSRHRGAITVAPRNLISELGGWKDLHVLEDLELWSRAARLGKFCKGEFPVIDSVTTIHPERLETRVGRMKSRYIMYRESLRTGIHSELWTKQMTWKRGFIKASMKLFVLPFYRSYVDSFNYGFSKDDPGYLVRLDASQ